MSVTFFFCQALQLVRLHDRSYTSMDPYGPLLFLDFSAETAYNNNYYYYRALTTVYLPFIY